MSWTFTGTQKGLSGKIKTFEVVLWKGEIYYFYLFTSPFSKKVGNKYTTWMIILKPRKDLSVLLWFLFSKLSTGKSQKTKLKYSASLLIHKTISVLSIELSSSAEDQLDVENKLAYELFELDTLFIIEGEPHTHRWCLSLFRIYPSSSMGGPSEELWDKMLGPEQLNHGSQHKVWVPRD